MKGVKFCQDCSNFTWCVFMGYRENIPGLLACHLYERKWWKFWRPS